MSALERQVNQKGRPTSPYQREGSSVLAPELTSPPAAWEGGGLICRGGVRGLTSSGETKVTRFLAKGQDVEAYHP